MPGIRLLNIRRRRQSGDTIVEVMMVLAVLGLALSICYSTANRSLLNARQAQENTVATELVQNQIEGIRVLMPNAVPSAPGSPITATTFCVVPDSTQPSGYAVKPVPNAGCTLPFAPTTSTITVIYCGASSTGVSAGAACGALNDDTFLVKATWPDIIASQGNDTVSQSYKVHQ